MTARTVASASGMLVALLRGKPAAVALTGPLQRRLAEASSRSRFPRMWHHVGRERRGHAAHRRGCQASRVRRFLFASSSATYENVAELPAPEDVQLAATSAHGRSKIAAEQVVTGQVGIAVDILRYFNVYGPGQDFRRSQTPVMSSFIMAALRDQAPVVFGAGETRRDYVHVDELKNSRYLPCWRAPSRDLERWVRQHNVGPRTASHGGQVDRSAADSRPQTSHVARYGPDVGRHQPGAGTGMGASALPPSRCPGNRCLPAARSASRASRQIMTEQTTAGYFAWLVRFIVPISVYGMCSCRGEETIPGHRRLAQPAAS